MKTLARAWVTCLALLVVPGWSDGILLRVEAENWTDQGGGSVQVIERTEASAGKTVSYWGAPGPWLDLAFDVPSQGEYRVSLRYSLSWPDTRRELSLDGEVLGTVTLQGTGGWEVFSTATLDLPSLKLAPGRHLLRVRNADSRGLSLDWAALHTGDVLLADRALSADELAALESGLLADVSARPGARLVHGAVELALGDGGEAAFARIAGALLGSARAVDGSQARWELKSAGQHRLLVVRKGGNQDGLLAVWISDGRSLFVAVRARQADYPLPAALVSAGGMRAVEATTEDGEHLLLSEAGLQRQARYLGAGGLHITAAPGLVISPQHAGASPVPDLRLNLRPWQGWSVGAARISPRWGSDRPAVGLEISKDNIAVTETRERFPTLSRFYGEGTFDLVFAPDGSAFFIDLLSGDSVEIQP